MYIIYWPNKNFKLLINTAIEWLSILFVKWDEQQMNFRNHVSCTQHLEVTQAFKTLKCI